LNGISSRLSFAEKTLEEIKKSSIIDNSLLRHLTVKYKTLDTETEYFKEKDRYEKKK
jgi:ribosomal protein S6